MKRITLFIILTVLLVFSATAQAAEYANWSGVDVTLNVLNPKGVRQLIRFPANAVKSLNYYISTTSVITLTSHTTKPPVPLPIKMLYEGAPTINPVTLTQAYPKATVYNGSGAILSLYCNEDDSASRIIRLKDNTYWTFDLTKRNIGTLHPSGAGGSDVIIQEHF